MKDRIKDRWEDFHSGKGAANMALEWPDDYVVRFAKRWLADDTIRTVLDMNCGAGRHTALLAELGFAATGYDISDAALELAAGLAQKRGVTATFKQGPSQDLPFADGAFDALVAWRTLHVFTREELPAIVAGMCRVVRPGGRLLVSTRSDRNIYDEARLGTVVHRPTDLTLEQVQELFGGVTVEQVELSEFTSQNRTLRDSYWVISAVK